MISNSGFYGWWLAAFPGKCHETLRSQIVRAVVLNCLKRQLSGFQFPRVDADILVTMGVVKEQNAIS
ncbi:MAG: hypothetical protein SXV54_03325 [Chloroflexota bacterium]|nr:hypothetical protein [Chloroflexota bacterium]